MLARFCNVCPALQKELELQVQVLSSPEGDERQAG